MTVTSVCCAAFVLAASGLPVSAQANGAGAAVEIPGLFGSVFGILALIGFVLAYASVIAEECA